MRKVIILVASFFLALVIGVTSSSNVLAQDATPAQSSFDTAFQTYSQAVNTYQSVRQDYILARSQYLNFKTLKSQTDAQNATIKFLQARDDVAITYFAALKEKINATQGLDAVVLNSVNSRVDIEVAWFTDHKNTVTTATSLADLVMDSNKALDRYNKDQAIIYEIISDVSLGRLNTYYQRVSDLMGLTKSKVASISAETRDDYKFSSDKLDRINRWIFDADSTLFRGKQKQDNVVTQIGGIGSIGFGNKKPADAYSGIFITIGESQGYYHDATSLISQIIKDIEISN